MSKYQKYICNNISNLNHSNKVGKWVGFGQGLGVTLNEKSGIVITFCSSI